MRTWQLALAAVVLATAAATTAVAAGLAFTSTRLGAATVSSPRCTANGLDVLPTLSGSTVAGVTVRSLPAACGGAVIRVSANNGTASASGSSVVAAGGGSVSIAISGGPGMDANVEIDLVMEGP